MEGVDVYFQPLHRHEMRTYFESPVFLRFVLRDRHVGEMRVRHVQVHSHVCRHIRHDLVLGDRTENLRVITSGFVPFGSIGIGGHPIVFIADSKPRQNLDIMGIFRTLNACVDR